MIKIKVNQAVMKRLRDANIRNYGGGDRYGEGWEILIPKSGFMEEFSAFNAGNNLCQIGAVSYSNAHIPRTDIKIGRYCSIAVGLNFIAQKHPLDLVSTSSFSYDPHFWIFKGLNEQNGGKFKAYSFGHFLQTPPLRP